MPPIDHPRLVPPASLLRAVRRLMRPLVCLMMRSGLTFPVLADSLRRLYLEITRDRDHAISRRSANGRTTTTGCSVRRPTHQWWWE